MDAEDITILGPAPGIAPFTVNGVTYTPTDGLTVARLRIFDRLGIQFGLDTTLRGIMNAHDEMSAAYSALDMPKLGHLIYERTEALNMSGQNRLKDVEICGLFYNAPGEDQGAYDFLAMEAKCYTQWAPVAGGFFYVKALKLLPTSRGSYGRLLDEPAPNGTDTTIAP